ncbi:MAG: hypothetical protein IKG89_05590, partial [Oscillospiraceae bacterium]|nr:hypothetical protein [Oscillospiraceae bacterium]
IAAARLRRRKSRGLCFRGLRGSRESLQTLDCFSSSNRSGCFGLKKDESPESRSSAVPAALRTIPGSEDAAAIAEFWPRNEFRAKMDFHSIRACGRELCEAFGTLSTIGPAGFRQVFFSAGRPSGRGTGKP